MGKVWTIPRIATAVLVLILGLWGASWVALHFATADWMVRSAFGEMFGAINALFSGLALAGVTLAIFLQREELQLQREELVATREELKRSAEAQGASSRALTQQLELMSISAQLTALNTLYHYQEARLGQWEDSLNRMKGVDLTSGTPALIVGKATEAREKRDRVVTRIDTLILNLEKRMRAEAHP